MIRPRIRIRSPLRRGLIRGIADRSRLTLSGRRGARLQGCGGLADRRRTGTNQGFLSRLGAVRRFFFLLSLPLVAKATGTPIVEGLVTGFPTGTIGRIGNTLAAIQWGTAVFVTIRLGVEDMG